MAAINRSTLLTKFNTMKAAREPIIGGGAGIGISAKSSEAGGIDMIILYNSGRYRMAGRGSAAGLLAYGNANDIVMEMADEILPVVKNTPVLAGVNGTDPFCDMDMCLDRVKARGFSGVQNFPTVGVIDGNFRRTLEETGMGYDLEVEMIRKAHDRDLLTTPYVFSADEAVKMAKAGADIIVAHFGTTVGGTIGVDSTNTINSCLKDFDDWAEAALAVRDDLIFLCHGGPLANPEDAEFMMKNAKHCHGFYGASSVERLPVETAIAAQVQRFKSIKF